MPRLARQLGALRASTFIIWTLVLQAIVHKRSYSREAEEVQSGCDGAVRSLNFRMTGKFVAVVLSRLLFLPAMVRQRGLIGLCLHAPKF